MGLFTLLLVVIVILALIGLWKTFSSGAISGFETVLDVGQPIMKNLIQEAREHINSVDMIIPLTFWH
jgi:hypothetical protein